MISVSQSVSWRLARWLSETLAIQMVENSVEVDRKSIGNSVFDDTFVVWECFRGELCSVRIVTKRVLQPPSDSSPRLTSECED